MLTSPFLLLGTALLMAGSDLDDHVVGVVLVLIFGPGLFALHRWAFPRSRGTHRLVLRRPKSLAEPAPAQ